MKIEVEKEENEKKEEELNMLERMRSLLVEVRVREEEGARYSSVQSVMISLIQMCGGRSL